jgi:hypothetical protein
LTNRNKVQTNEEKQDSVTKNNGVEKEESDLLKRKAAEEKERRRTRGPYRKSSGSNAPNYNK